MKSPRVAQLLWLIAAIFVIACFFSGAWLGKTLSTMPPVSAPSGGSAVERTDQQRVRIHERDMAIATAIGSPIAILILLLSGLVVSGAATRGAATSTPRMDSNAARRKID